MRISYRVQLEFTVQMDDETFLSVQKQIQEHINMMYHIMEREGDIRIILQHKFEVKEMK